MLIKKIISKPGKYFDYSNVFSAKNAAELLENTEINEHAIELEEANDFIWPFKSSTKAPILFDKKPDRSLRFCVNY